MSSAKLQLGIMGAIALAGIASFVIQQRASLQLRDDIVSQRQQNEEAARLRAENRRLAKAAKEFSASREDAATLTQLRETAGALRQRVQAETARVQQIAMQSDSVASVGADTSAVYEIAQLSQQPRPKTQSRPAYPAAMRAAGIAGEVTVDFVIDAKGEVRDAYVVKSSRPEFDAAAIETVTKGKFGAGEKDGKAVNVHMQVQINFGPPPKPPQ